MAYVIGIPLVALVGGVIEAWGIYVLWGWFVTPVFGIPVPTKLACYGLALVAALFFHQSETLPRDVDEKDPLWKMYWIFLRTPAIVLFGWVARELFL